MQRKHATITRDLAQDGGGGGGPTPLGGGVLGGGLTRPGRCVWGHVGVVGVLEQWVFVLCVGEVWGSAISGGIAGLYIAWGECTIVCSLFLQPTSRLFGLLWLFVSCGNHMLVARLYVCVRAARVPRAIAVAPFV